MIHPHASAQWRRLDQLCSMTSLPGRRAQACSTRPVPWLRPHAKTVPQSETRRNVKCKGKNGIASSNLIETQNKSSDTNKLVDMAMENMYCKIIAFSHNSSFSFAILYFGFQKVNLVFSILSFSFAKLYSFAYIYIYMAFHSRSIWKQVMEIYR